MKRLLQRYLRGTEDLPLARLFAPFGVTLVDGRDPSKAGLGVRTAREGADCKLANVHEGGAAHRAGLSAGDLLVALDDLRVTATNLDGLLARHRVGDRVTLHAFRRDELMRFEVRLGGGRSAADFVDDAIETLIRAAFACCVVAKDAVMGISRGRGRWLGAPALFRVARYGHRIR